MIETLITLLIYICILVAVVYLVLWVIASIGVPLPGQVIKIIWIIVALLVILWLVRSLPGLGLHLRL